MQQKMEAVVQGSNGQPTQAQLQMNQPPQSPNLSGLNAPLSPSTLNATLLAPNMNGCGQMPPPSLLPQSLNNTNNVNPASNAPTPNNPMLQSPNNSSNIQQPIQSPVNNFINADAFRLSSPSPNSNMMSQSQGMQPPSQMFQQQQQQQQQQPIAPQHQFPNQNYPNNFNNQPPINQHQQMMQQSAPQNVHFHPQQQQQQLNSNNMNSSQNQFRLCSSCNTPIRDRYLLQCLDRLWHVQCLKCQVCKVTLSDLGEKCFTRDQKILCRDDYFKIYGANCVGGRCETCQKAILGNEQVMKTHTSVYHVDCFMCSQCRIQLKTGDKYCYVQGRIYCEKDNPALNLNNQLINQQLNGANNMNSGGVMIPPNGMMSQNQQPTPTKRSNSTGGTKRNKTAKATAAALAQQQQQQQQHQQMMQQQMINPQQPQPHQMQQMHHMNNNNIHQMNIQHQQQQQQQMMQQQVNFYQEPDHLKQQQHQLQHMQQMQPQQQMIN